MVRMVGGDTLCMQIYWKCYCEVPMKEENTSIYFLRIFSQTHTFIIFGLSGARKMEPNVRISNETFQDYHAKSKWSPMSGYLMKYWNISGLSGKTNMEPTIKTSDEILKYFKITGQNMNGAQCQNIWWNIEMFQDYLVK